MKRNAMGKNLRQSILRSFGRYIAIVMIIALGSGMFVGLLMTKSDMISTGQRFMDENNMFDLRLMNPYGWTDEHVDAVASMDGVVDAEGIRYIDLIVRCNESPDDLVYRFYAMPQKVNLFVLKGGRMPEKSDECLIDGYHLDDSVLGTTITLSESNDDAAFDAVAYKTYTVVGYISSPLYMDMNRGTTSVGSGSLSNYIYIPRESFLLDYYAEINITIPGDYEIYSQAYNDAMEAMAERLEPLLQPYADARLEEVRQDAQCQLAEGLQEYYDGLKEFQKGEQEANKQLLDGEQQLADSEQQLADAETLILQGEQQLATARGELAEAEKALEEGKAELMQLKKTLLEPVQTSQSRLQVEYAGALAEQAALNDQIGQLDGQIAQIRTTISEEQALLDEIDGKIAQIDSELNTVNSQLQGAKSLLALLNLRPEANADLITQLNGTIADLERQAGELNAKKAALEGEKTPILATIQEPLAKIESLEEQKSVIQSQLERLDISISAMEAALQGFERAVAEVQATLAESEAQIAEAEQQIKAGWDQVYANEAKLKDARRELENGRLELEKGRKEYAEGKAEAKKELAEAKAELTKARAVLENAADMIAAMTDSGVIILDRNSNIGYNSLDSSSNIMEGVSRVFPAFFLLVAAMVCITTMTRMVDEERTQIGTLKALGYSNAAIISKYLIYAGSGAVLGCGLGVLAGSVVFPTILWQAYKIMLHITDTILLKFNWWLCGAVVGAYTVVMLLVTWYCCRRCLREAPAELIRPKAPDAGRKILLERLPFWKNISFLNKVTIRNIFRYRQRLAMMMLGIGGCTALLVTGFGIRDSIVNVVDYQFEEVTTYDLSVYFTGNQSFEQQEEFRRDVGYGAESILFYHQSSVEISSEDRTKEIYLIGADSGVKDFIDFHCGSEPLSMPGIHEVLLSSGVADALNIRAGDTVELRNADLRTLELTVSGIYDNHVYNYAIVTPDTIVAQWGELPAMQMAFVHGAQDQDIHQLSAEITGLPNVMNVAVSEDLADMVGNMMDAMDLVVIVIVVCAGLLAAIVLYNLTNININERIREIATIKVLGFNAQETGAYVFKENLSLSVIGCVLGLGLGYLLLQFVMSQIRIDMVWFKAMAMPMSYVWSIGLTILSACLVDFVFYFKLDKINMAEALKSVE